MNTTILSRCITELQQEKPDISYIRGALETLLEMSAPPPALPMPYAGMTPHYTLENDPNVKRTESVADEEIDATTAAYLAGGPVAPLTETGQP